MKLKKAVKPFMNFLMINFGLIITVAAVYLFLIPSKCSISSVSGLSLVLSNFISMNISTISMIINVVLLILGLIFIGKDFGIKSIYTTVMFSVYLALFEIILPDFKSLTGDEAIDALCYIVVVSVGCSILFNLNASSGGMDIVAKLINKFFHIELGKAMSAVGMLTALSSALVYDSKIVVLSVLGSYFNGIILDYMIFNKTHKKRVCIISKNFEAVKDYILNDIKSGLTVYESYGGLNMTPQKEIITIVDRQEYQKLRNFLRKEDPTAFVTIYQVNDVSYVPKFL